MALTDFPLIEDYGDAAAEAKACRAHCALFDFSFLECARLAGARARRTVEAFTGRSSVALATGRISYALRVDARATAVADLTVWRTGEESFEVMSGRSEDIADLLSLAGAGLDGADMSAERAVYAIQGPASLAALLRLGVSGPIERLRYFHFCDAAIGGMPCMVGRLGYTGEPGFEIVVPRRHARELWHSLSLHARPAGFVAADALRIEAGLVLFKNEFSLPVTPWEAGLGKFFGAPAQGRASPLALISFRADARDLNWPWSPPRVPRRPTVPAEIAVTSACQSALAGGILGLGYIVAGTPAGASLRDPTGTFSNIHPTAMPFYDTAKQRPRAPWHVSMEPFSGWETL